MKDHGCCDVLENAKPWESFDVVLDFGHLHKCNEIGAYRR